MVSRRNYFTITIVMFIVFILFQFTNVVLESFKGYEKNPYAVSRQELSTRSTAYETGEKKEKSLGDETRRQVVYIGDESGLIGSVVYNWAVYTKRKISIYRTIAEYEAAGEQDRSQNPEFFVMDAAGIDWKKEDVCEVLTEYTEKGINLIFSNLPDVSVIEETPELKKILGIKEIRESKTSVDGIYLRDGFLLGGEAVYQSEDKDETKKRQNMELSFPWYVLSSGADTYMHGLPAKKIKEEYPPVIWRNKCRKAYVFAVNGRYMEDAAGLGLLSAMSAKVKEYEIYPVVNAQNMLIVNYPSLASENEEEMKKRYGQTTSDALWNIAWPSIISAYRKNTLGLSCMMTPQYDYEEDNFPSQTSLEFYMKRMKEQSAEAGLSGESVSDTPVGQKLQEDGRFMKKALPDYEFTSFYTGEMTEVEVESVLEEELLKSVRTIVADYSKGSDVIGYLSDSITKQSALSDGTRHTYMEDFRVRCVETALGYTSVRMDVSDGIYPKSNQEGIDGLVSDFNWNIRYHWKKYQAFSGTTVSECDQRIRNFMAVDYTQQRKNHEITLDYTSMEKPVWFVLRTEKEAVRRIEGGESKMIEEGSYLIEAKEDQVTIELAPIEE
ncbi:MAG: DUF2194 domain-containing protein [Dorea sp.]|jgi:hypothetical protein|nr:DUF2194 domain-containing protein [Dorea sp.]